jgi:CRP-like cAMP-binding protein
MDQKYWYLKNCDLFSRLSASQISHLESRSVSKTFDRGGVIYLPSDRNDSVALLARGRVRLYHLTNEGKQAILAIMDPGEMFGELSLMEDGSRDEFAEAMEKTTVILVPREEVQSLMAEYPDVALGVTRLMGFRRQRIERRLKSLLFKSNRERLVHLLVELSAKYGQQTEDGVQIGIKLSHQELANIIGSTRETVTVLLGELQTEGSLLIRRRQLIIKQLSRLADSVDMAAPTLPVPAAPFAPRRLSSSLI